jgi:hypothetical protein
MIDTPDRLRAIMDRMPRDGKNNTIGVCDVVWVVSESHKISDGIVDVAVFPIQVIAVDDCDGVVAAGNIRVLGRQCFLDMREAFREARQVMLAKEGQRKRLREMALADLYDPKPGSKPSIDTTV